MYEIRIHSRGGQGGVTAAKLLALAAFRDGKHATACPFYGAERRGAAVVSYVRIDDQPIRIYSQIRRPDLVIVLDTSVMDVVDVLQGLKENGTVLLNSAHTLEECNGTCRHVDLTGIALAENLIVAGSPILNTPVLGALAKMGVITLSSARSAIQEMFADERNVKAAEAAYEELKV
ncbi:pyruvate ferredoxin oxidoreductase [Methanoculleus sp. Wushi-C6]|uniref:pyruvate synthase n=1 Tax=Methanoculleus caldifontis TaxID=2651577 RepID=A0ABU3WYM4_9EURY|nr:2-oxoacid:acceptor oxidoreductase family protein [Methanoculleus sp. Wushi-C6]MDV2480894.1 pyruvate ferredoxin oxidoreductase [Methanoculleus sp. Wushi-C6]